MTPNRRKVIRMGRLGERERKKEKNMYQKIFPHFCCFSFVNFWLHLQGDCLYAMQIQINFGIHILSWNVFFFKISISLS